MEIKLLAIPTIENELKLITNSSSSMYVIKAHEDNTTPLITLINIIESTKSYKKFMESLDKFEREELDIRKRILNMSDEGLYLAGNNLKAFSEICQYISYLSFAETKQELTNSLKFIVPKYKRFFKVVRDESHEYWEISKECEKYLLSYSDYISIRYGKLTLTDEQIEFWNYLKSVHKNTYFSTSSEGAYNCLFFILGDYIDLEYELEELGILKLYRAD